jgi:acetate kinase
MSRHVITLNAGSSSIKFSYYETEPDLHPLAVGLIETKDGKRHIVVKDGDGALMQEASWGPEANTPFHTDALQRILDWRRATYPHANVVAAGHRVVHGGIRYATPALVTEDVLDYLKSLDPLAPLHQPHNIAGILAAQQAWPDVQQVACFDTAFHRLHPFVDDTFALPRRYYDAGVRRYGFHGLSYEYITRYLKQHEPFYAEGRIVVAHLGNGASMCAIRDGVSVASTMGFTALDGLPMGTRCGQLDPGVVLYMMTHEKMSADEIQRVLYNESGLKGLSGLSNDMRELEASDTPEAAEAIEYFVFRIRRELGGLAASLKGLDALVFCGGIGEHAWHVRERVLEGMEWIGIELNRTANRASEFIISSDRSRVRVFVIPTSEEEMIVRHTLKVIDEVQ